MTREQYLEYAKRNEIPMELLYEYYNKFNTKPDINFSLETFAQAFTQFLATFAPTFETCRTYFDNLYGINKAYSKDNKLITIF
jgi:hypothetical protein